MVKRTSRVTVFNNGRVFSADDRQPWADAVAIENGEIVAVGSDADVAPYISRADEVVSLGERLLVPGFIDAHAHPLRAGLERLRCNLLNDNSLPEYQRTIASYANSHPEQYWIIGGGWSFEAFGGYSPHRKFLDAVISNRPVCLPDNGHHSVWVNSLALEVAGIDATTPDPQDGRIERDSDGNPTGVLHEGASALVEKHIPAETDADYDAALREALRFMHSHGIVGWQDAMVRRPGPAAASHESYMRAQVEGWLSAQVMAALWWERDCPPDLISEHISELVAARSSAASGGERYRANSVKIMLDGVIETGTAALLEPYCDGCGGDAGSKPGLSFLDPAVLKLVVTELDRFGFQVHFHALGDRAVQDALDAVQAAQANNNTGDRRHQLAHLQLVGADDIQRFKELGAIANLQGLWGVREPLTDQIILAKLGSKREPKQFPYGDLYRAGVDLAMGSDWPISSVDPIAALHASVNRKSFGAPQELSTLGVNQQIDLAAALTAYTAGSAWANQDSNGGSISVGKRADMVMLDRNPFEAPIDEIGASRVQRTYVGGDVVFDSEGC